jgi:predicted O-methyltransferase YrrM
LGAFESARARLKATLCEAIRRYHQALPEFTRLYAGTPAKPGPVFAKEAQFLFALTRILMPRGIVEIGVGGAASTLAFAEGLRQNGGTGHLASIEHSPELAARANVLLKTHGLQRQATILVGSSADSAIKAQAAARVAQVDMLMIDGDHSFDAVLHDFELFRDLVAPSGLILFHDTGSFPVRYLDLVEGLPREPNAAPPVLTADRAGIYHRPDVARAVDWILEHYSEYSGLSIHADAEASCGIAILQRHQAFFTPATDRGLDLAQSAAPMAA